MKERLMCKLLGLHKYEILKEEKLQDKRGVVIGWSYYFSLYYLWQYKTT